MKKQYNIPPSPILIIKAPISQVSDSTSSASSNGRALIYRVEKGWWFKGEGTRILREPQGNLREH